MISCANVSLHTLSEKTSTLIHSLLKGMVQHLVDSLSDENLKNKIMWPQVLHGNMEEHTMFDDSRPLALSKVLISSVY